MAVFFLLKSIKLFLMCHAEPKIRSISWCTRANVNKKVLTAITHTPCRKIIVLILFTSASGVNFCRDIQILETGSMLRHELYAVKQIFDQPAETERMIFVSG